MKAFYPELEDINGYETEDNKLNDYGSQQANEAHIDNMIQKYKRLTVGSLDLDNVRKYQERLEYWEEQKMQLSERKYADAVDINSKKYYNLHTDKEQFERYRAVLGSLAPQSFEEFQRIKHEDPTIWNRLKAQYRVVNQYKIDSGYLSPKEILELDNKVITEKRTQFTSKFKKSGNIAGAYINNDKENMYFAHSQMSDDFKGYKGSSKLVPLKENRRFKYIEVPTKDGKYRFDTYQDTEAKLFECFADMCLKNEIESITMLSERGMCESCIGVMKQFKTLFPNVKINIVSHKKTIGNVWKYRRR